MDAHAAEFVATVLEGFLDEEAHAHEFGTGLLHEVENTLGRVAVGQEVIDEEHLVALLQIVAAHANVVGALLCEGEDGGLEHVFHRAGSLFLGEHHGEFEQIAHHDGGGDAAGFDGDNLVDVRAGEAAHEFNGHGLHEDGVHLMVDEIVDFQDASFEASAVAKDTVFECFHVAWGKGFADGGEKMLKSSELLCILMKVQTTL